MYWLQSLRRRLPNCERYLARDAGFASTYLPDRFLPKLRAAGVDEETVRQLTHTNPFRAFAR